MFRTIIKTQQRNLLLTLPEKYVGRNLAVLVFPVKTDNDKEKTKKCFEAISLKTVGFKFNREEANER
jgi:hypothetical protein